MPGPSRRIRMGKLLRSPFTRGHLANGQQRSIVKVRNLRRRSPVREISFHRFLPVAQDLMNLTPRLLLIGALLVITAHRLPAPIQEIPDTPTPTPTPTAQSQSNALPAMTTERADPAQFAGTWTGKIKIGSAAESDVTLMVNSEATSLTQVLKRLSERVHETTHPTTISGHMLSWRGGQMGNVAWTLTPNPDDRTAVATTKMGAGVENTAILQRVDSSVNPSEPPTRKYPGAKVKRNPGN